MSLCHTQRWTWTLCTKLLQCINNIINNWIGRRPIFVINLYDITSVVLQTIHHSGVQNDTQNHIFLVFYQTLQKYWFLVAYILNLLANSISFFQQIIGWRPQIELLDSWGCVLTKNKSSCLQKDAAASYDVKKFCWLMITISPSVATFVVVMLTGTFFIFSIEHVQKSKQKLLTLRGCNVLQQDIQKPCLMSANFHIQKRVSNS